MVIEMKEASSKSKQMKVRYHHSDQFNSSHFIHKYYLSPEDQSKLFPVDISAIEEMFADELQQKDFPEGTILYSDLSLEKHLDCNLIRRVLQAVAEYRNDQQAELTVKEMRAALNLNEWLRGYERSLCTKRQSIEQELIKGDPFLVDYEIELKIDFYVREDDLFYESDEANEYDWDKDASLMCRLSYCSRFTHGLFHELTSHCGVPLKHLIRIGTIWADFEVVHQNAVDIDLSGESIVANQKVVQFCEVGGDKSNFNQSFHGESGSEKIR